MITFIKENYLEIPIKTMAKLLGKSNYFVRGILRENNLKVPPHIIQQFKDNSYFKKGHVTFNKGLKMIDYLPMETIAKIKKTQFKKGNKSLTAYEENHIVIYKSKGRLYFKIKLKGKLIYLHRHIYQLTHGDIPVSHNIQFKDGNSLNVHPNNLYAISRQNQSMVNKMGGYTIPFEYYESIKLIQSINKKINEKQNNGSK